MDKQLSSETVTALRALTREIGDARGLDGDAREELYGHLEDKTLGYMSGEEGLSEADAVLLTRAHFGESVPMDEAVPQANGNPRRVTLLHRVLMVAGVTFVLGSLLQRTAMSLTWTILEFDPPQFLVYAIVLVVISGATTWLLAILAGLTLRRWERYVRAGTVLRFDPSNSKHLGAAIGVVVFLVFSFMISALPPPRLSGSSAAVSQAFSGSVAWLYVGSAVAWPLLWIWWFDRRSGRMKNFAFGALAWAGFQFVFRMVASIATGTVSLTFSTLEGPTTIFDRLAYLLHRPFTTFYLPMLFAQAGAAFVLYLVYAAWRDGVHLRPAKARAAIN
jgi:hypothetical protein